MTERRQPGGDGIEIVLVCQRGHKKTVLGRFDRPTRMDLPPPQDNCDDDPEFYVGGSNPMVTAPDGHSTAIMRCPRCGHSPQFRAERIRDALSALYESGADFRSIELSI